MLLAARSIQTNNKTATSPTHGLVSRIFRLICRAPLFAQPVYGTIPGDSCLRPGNCDGNHANNPGRPPPIDMEGANDAYRTSAERTHATCCLHWQYTLKPEMPRCA